MKTSNKLLLGLFCLVVIGMIIANIALKREIDHSSKRNDQIEVNMSTDSISIEKDSIAMDSAISNE